MATHFKIPFGAAMKIGIPFALSIPLWIGIYSGLMYRTDYIQSRSWRQQDPRVFEEYDFIIVGGGSSGAVVANRLSKSEYNNVLLLELGGDPNPLARMGLSHLLLQRCPGTDLMYETVSGNNTSLGLANNKVFWPRGLGLGGSSNLNAMIYHRGNPNDYDNWAKITGNPEWSYEKVLPYFKKLEDYHGAYPNDKYHGTGGPIHVEKVKQSYMEKYFLQAAREKGYPIKDLNGRQTEGFSYMDSTTKDGLRWGTYQGYIKPILQRKNLKIYRYSRVIKVHLDKNRHAYGVTFFRHGLRRFVRARKEIIISAGAVDTPKLLMLSGIGPMDHLHRVGLKCRVNLPVGQNLQDHLLTMMGPFIVDTPEAILPSRLGNLMTLTDFFKRKRSGIFASTAISATALVSSSVNNNPAWPDVQFTLIPFGIFHGLPEVLTRIFNFKPGFLRKYFGHYLNEAKGKDANIVLVSLQRPKSIGEIKLNGRNPFSHPIIQPNYFKHKDDMKAMIDGLRIIVDLYENTTTYKGINARLIENPLPGCEHEVKRTDAYYECHLRQITFTIYHPVGTAAMGKNLRDKRSVVNPELRVFKTTGLRVIDASIMPVLVNANTNIPAVMIGEVGSMFIRRHWQDQYLICPWKEYLFNHDEDTKCFYSRIV